MRRHGRAAKVGRKICREDTLLQAFHGTAGPAGRGCHLNGQQTLTAYEGDGAEGIA